MILPVYLKNLKDLQGSTVSVNYIGPKNAPYRLTGEFQRIAFSVLTVVCTYYCYVELVPINRNTGISCV